MPATWPGKRRTDDNSALALDGGNITARNRRRSAGRQPVDELENSGPQVSLYRGHFCPLHGGHVLGLVGSVEGPSHDKRFSL